MSYYPNVHILIFCLWIIFILDNSAWIIGINVFFKYTNIEHPNWYVYCFLDKAQVSYLTFFDACALFISYFNRNVKSMCQKLSLGCELLFKCSYINILFMNYIYIRQLSLIYWNQCNLQIYKYQTSELVCIMLFRQDAC